MPQDTELKNPQPKLSYSNQASLLITFTPCLSTALDDCYKTNWYEMQHFQCPLQGPEKPKLLQFVVPFVVLKTRLEVKRLKVGQPCNPLKRIQINPVVAQRQVGQLAHTTGNLIHGLGEVDGFAGLFKGQGGQPFHPSQHVHVLVCEFTLSH